MAATQAGEQCFVFGRLQRDGVRSGKDHTKTERLVMFFWQENNANYLIAQNKKFQSAFFVAFCFFGVCFVLYGHLRYTKEVCLLSNEDSCERWAGCWAKGAFIKSDIEGFLIFT